MGNASFERRIGARKYIVPLQVGWRVDRPSDARRPKRKKRTAEEQTAVVVEISVTGAAIDAPHSPDLVRGQRVNLLLQGMYGTVVIRRAGPTADPGIVRYGVEFIEMDPGLTERMHELVAADRPDDLEERWRRAT